MTVERAEFYTVEETAELLKISDQQVVNAIETGELTARRFGKSHRASRIPHRVLFPDDGNATELKTERLRRLVLKQKRAQETAERLCREWGEAQMRAEEASRAVYDELGLQEVDAALERMTG